MLTHALNMSTRAQHFPHRHDTCKRYAPYLKKIVASLQSAPALAKTKLLFGITTPMLCKASTDAVQSTLNKQAVAIMAAAGA